MRKLREGVSTEGEQPITRAPEEPPPRDWLYG